MMKKYTLPLLLAIAGGSATTALAADGSVQFLATVVSSACVVTPFVNVVIDDIPVEKLLNVGSIVSEKVFEIELSNCPAHVPTAQIRFEGTAMTDDNSVFELDAPESLETARGIALRIRNNGGEDSSTIFPNTSSNTRTLDTTAGNSNKLSFAAGYKVLSKDIKLGGAIVSTQFTVIYP